MPDKVIVLNEGPPWGFRMTGGKNTGSPLKISRVNNVGKAAKAGVREGFLIESINSASVDHLTSNEAQALIRNSGDTLTIGIYKQSKTNNIVQTDHKHKAEAKSCVEKSARSKQEDTETSNKKGKRVRKRRRKKKRANSPEHLNSQQPNTLPVKIIERTKEETQIVEFPKIEIIPDSSDLVVGELDWIKQNEAILIAELESRRQAGLPIQAVVRVEKITPSTPEYCQIIPDFCHLDVIKEETSASDEDPRKDCWECPEQIRKANSFQKLPNNWEGSDIDEENNRELENISEINLNKTVSSDYHLERLESPSLVRELEILRFADIITTENECVIELEPVISFNNAPVNVNYVENNVCVNQEKSFSNKNLNIKIYENRIEDMKKKIYQIEHENTKNQIEHENTDNQIEHENTKNQIEEENTKNQIEHEKTKNQIELENTKNQIKHEDRTLNKNTIINLSHKEHKLITNKMLTKDDTKCINCPKTKSEFYCNDELVNNSEVVNTNSQTIHHAFLTESNTSKTKYNGFSKSYHDVKPIEVLCQKMDHEESSDDSTIKQNEMYNHRYKTQNQNRISINDKLKQIARSLHNDTDDYEEIQSSQTTSRSVSIASDADVDTDWVSFTLSDGESSMSLCLSPSQLRSGHAPSTISETSEIIDLHKKFLSRTRSPNLFRHQDNSSVDILKYDEKSPSTSPSKSYSSEVFDEACRMCGTSDEPLSDAECLVSLRKYRETRSRLLDVIQKEQRVNRSVIDQPSSMPTFIDTLSVPDNHTRELMYTEYMEKVKEREDRLHNKVIRITKASRPLSSGTLQTINAIDAEFVTKARERLGKLGVEADEFNIVVKEEYYPKHLVDIVPEEEVCIEEVQMNGVWSPELKHKSLDLENISRRTEKKQPQAELPPVWTPNSSPTPNRKTYKPIKFESPTLSRKKIVNVDTKKVSPQPASDLPVLSSPPPPPPPSLPINKQGGENVHITDRRLPRVQSPTITLLQKAREGQLPKGSAYLESEEYNMDKENKMRGSSVKRNVETEEMKYTSRREYGSQSDEKKQKKMVEISTKKYEGIGPTTKEGVPIVLRSEIKEPNQPKWYKQMYESLHKFQSDDEGVTVRYKTREPKKRNVDGYLSEPEKGYESDFGENRLFQNFNGEHTKNVSTRRSVSPVKCGQNRYKNQPRPIENYEPGHSSIAEKETKQFWDDMVNAFDEDSEHRIPPPQNRLSSKKSNLSQALKESGYDSDSTLVFKRREIQSQCLSPTEQKTAYKVIQSGGEIPFQGLRKTAPERPKDSPHKYTESEVTLQSGRRPVRNEIKEEWSEEDLANKQAEAMRRIYQEERRRKYLQELQDMSNRRHTDNLLPSQKSPISLNRYDDFIDESPQPPRSRTPEPKLVARALYNFVGQTSRELSFRKGDIIFVRKQIDKNWYEGEHNAMVGLFPFNYVEVIPYDGIRTTPHRPYEGQARAKFNFVAQTNMELSLVKGELVVLTRRVDNNWYEGRIGNRKGIFPVSYVTVLVEPGDHPNSSTSTSFKPVASPAAHSLITSNPPKTQHMYQPDSYSSMPKRNSGTQTKKQTNNVNETLHVDVHSEPIPYRALYNYKPQNSDELELREGDVVFVMEKCDDGWYVGSSKRTGCFGTFPGNYVQRSI